MNQFHNFALRKIFVKNMAEKEKSGVEIIESAEALQKEFNKAEGFLKNNQKVLLIAGVAIIAAVAGFFGYNYYNDSQNEAAQVAMYDAVYAFEADSLNQALNGTGGNEGLLSIAENYAGTKAGKLANFYVGIIYMKQAKYDEAILAFEKFSSDDAILQSKAYALIGDANVEKKNLEQAITFYQKAASHKPNKFFTPVYLSKLAAVYTESKKINEAIDTYKTIIEEYATSTEAVNAKKYKARLEATIGE
jgi:predicted negative regulator of RcsB-dependent stress response